MFETLKNNILESYNELMHKVTWSTWPSLISTTVLVLIASAIFGILVLGMDLVSKQVLNLIYSL